MHHDPLVPSRVTVTGDPSTWARDLAIVGGVTGFAAPALVIADPVFSLAAAVAGASLGLALGASVATALERLRTLVPLWMLICASPFVGLAWGGAKGFLAGLVGGSAFGSEAPALGLLLGGLAGMVQLGWFFLPYTVLAVTRGPRWPVVLAAFGVAPMLGWVAFTLLLLSPVLLASAVVLGLPVGTFAAYQLSAQVRRARLAAPRAKPSRICTSCGTRCVRWRAGSPLWPPDPRAKIRSSGTPEAP
jgi:hypothetical protein